MEMVALTTASMVQN
jgi:hypothetical protein